MIPEWFIQSATQPTELPQTFLITLYTLLYFFLCGFRSFPIFFHTVYEFSKTLHTKSLQISLFARLDVLSLEHLQPDQRFPQCLNLFAIKKFDAYYVTPMLVNIRPFSQLFLIHLPLSTSEQSAKLFIFQEQVFHSTYEQLHPTSVIFMNHLVQSVHPEYICFILFCISRHSQFKVPLILNLFFCQGSVFLPCFLLTFSHPSFPNVVEHFYSVGVLFIHAFIHLQNRLICQRFQRLLLLHLSLLLRLPLLQLLLRLLLLFFDLFPVFPDNLLTYLVIICTKCATL